MSFYLNRRNKDWLIDWLFEFDTSNTALQHCCYIVSNGWNVVSTFESCAALKSSLRIVTWHHLNGFIFWIINQSLIEFWGGTLDLEEGRFIPGVPFPFPCAPFALLSCSFPFKGLPRRLHALWLHCWLTWIFDILILDRLSTITAMPYWWAPIGAKQLSMTATARVIWLCACVRYWPGRG